MALLVTGHCPSESVGGFTVYAKNGTGIGPQSERSSEILHAHC